MHFRSTLCRFIHNLCVNGKGRREKGIRTSLFFHFPRIFPFHMRASPRITLKANSLLNSRRAHMVIYCCRLRFCRYFRNLYEQTCDISFSVDARGANRTSSNSSYFLGCVLCRMPLRLPRDAFPRSVAFLHSPLGPVQFNATKMWIDCAASRKGKAGVYRKRRCRCCCRRHRLTATGARREKGRRNSAKL